MANEVEPCSATRFQDECLRHRARNTCRCRDSIGQTRLPSYEIPHYQRHGGARVLLCLRKSGTTIGASREPVKMRGEVLAGC